MSSWSASPSTINSQPSSGRQADTSWLHLSRKQDRRGRGRSVTDAFRHFDRVPTLNPLTLKERKSHEARSPLPKPIALSQELQTKSCHPNPPGETPLRFSPGALRFETADPNCLVAQ